MHLETLTLQNFRCFGQKPVAITFKSGINAFVGNNGSGKTAALEALKRLFSPISAERQIRKTDVHFGPTEDLQMLKGLEREIVIDAVFGFEDPTAYPMVFSDLFFSAADSKLRVRIRLECKYSSSDALTDDLETKIYSVKTLDNVPFGPDDERKTPLRGRPTQYAEVIYIPAHRDARGVSQTALRNLLSRLESAADWSEDTRSKSKGFAADLEQNLNSTDAMKYVSATLDGFWKSLHDGHYDGTPQLGVVATEFQKLIKDLTLRFTKSPGGGQRYLDELSEGQTSLLYFALAATYQTLMWDMQKARPNLVGFRPSDFTMPALTIFALEEPENHLSPFYLPRLVALLDSLNRTGSAQAIVTSHATSILSRVPPKSVRYFRTSPQTLTSTVLPLPLPQEKTEEDKFIQQVILANPEIYFARLVIIGEGDTERIVIPKLAEARGASLDPSFIAYVSIGGRHAHHLWKLLNGLEIPHLTLLDFDLGRYGGGTGRLKNAVAWLTALGPEFVPTYAASTDQPDVEIPANVNDIPTNEGLTPQNYDGWVKWLRKWGIYYSAPLDLDMMMIQAFPEAYIAEKPYAPESYNNETRKKLMEAVFGASGKGLPEIEATGNKITEQQVHIYRELFKSSSKPGSHLLAFSKLSKERLETGCPEPLQALIEKAGSLVSAANAQTEVVR